MAVKNVVILGSTGSIGINALNVIERLKGKFKVLGLTAYHNVGLLHKQIKKFSPRYVAVAFEGIGYLRKHLFSKSVQIFNVDSEIDYIVSRPEVDIVLIAMRGSGALSPFLSAVRCGKTVVPANKEALVIAGDIIMAEAKKYKAKIIPIDSEQSAIFQCLEGRNKNELKKIYLTASGGPLLDVPKKRFDQLSVQDILRHPRWKMGKKITVDSATLMNKGFEVIEAKRLFDVTLDQINVVIHPEAVIHSMVEFQDGSILAQMGATDMRLPIQYALSYPHRYKSGVASMDFSRFKKLTFAQVDQRKFPALDLCFYAAQKSGTLPCVLNAADEEAVEAFLTGYLSFSRIYKVVEKVVLKHTRIKKPALDQILAADQWAREEARKIIFN